MGGCLSGPAEAEGKHESRVGPGDKSNGSINGQQQGLEYKGQYQAQLGEGEMQKQQALAQAQQAQQSQAQAQRARAEEEELRRALALEQLDRQQREQELQRQQQQQQQYVEHGGQQYYQNESEVLSQQQQQQQQQQAAAAAAAAGLLRQVNEDEDDGMWEVNVHDTHPPELQEYSYQDLVAAADNFQETSVLGEGGFGKVYRGTVMDRFPAGGGGPREAVVAIKKLNPSGYQSKVEWMREILVLGKLQHPNLVRLIGCCAEVEEMLLVYEFVPQGSLDYHLWPAPNSNAMPLTWQARLRIAHDAAAGLAHLHASNFIHRDFKAPNILIDQDFSGKLTDFGLAKDGPDAGQTHVSTQIMGTMGYLDPRYAETGQLTVKSDVYAYGVVLLELLTGKKAMGISPGGKPKTLTSWARPLLSKGRPDLESLVDPNLIDPFPEKVARTLAISAKHCIQDDTSMRPMMSDIVDTLRPLNQAINGRR